MIDFLARFDYPKTYGFSIAYAPDRITRNKNMMESLGLKLPFVVLDLYGQAGNPSYYWDLTAYDEEREFDLVARELVHNSLQSSFF
jgi:hypothetical protein